jgi:pimeloyl-ACP methyl ester carboxylesterase
MKASVNNIQLNYEEHGQGTPVLLIHAFPLNSAMWQQQIKVLAAEYRLIVPDLRGFGESDVPEGTYTMDTFADDLAALLDHLNIDKAVLAGVSMGGYISFAFMRGYADRVRALMLASTRATPDSEEAKAGREKNAQLAESEGVGVIAENMIPNLLSGHADQDLRDEVRSIIERNQPRGVAGALRGMGMRPDSSNLLTQITVPTLVVSGADDSITPPEEMQILHKGLSGSRIAEVPKAGHLVNLENPTVFNHVVTEFLHSV